MKNFFKYLAVGLVLIVPAVSWAADFRAGENPSVGRDEQLLDDVYVAGGSVTSAGSVVGDLITGGGNVVVSGDVTEDVFVGGGNISILSNVGDDVRVAGGTIVIAGRVGGDLLAGGGQVTVSGSGITGDAAVAGGTVHIDAPIAGELVVAGGTVYLNAPIAGDVKVKADKLTLGSEAIIDGNLTYTATQEMTREDGAVVGGAIDFKLHPKKAITPKAAVAILSALLAWKFLATLICALLIGLGFRRYSKELIALAQHRPWFEIGRGLLVAIVMPILSVVLLTTLVGIPFGVMGLLGFAILMIFAWLVTPIIVGSVVYQYFSKKDIEVSWKTILLGVIVYFVLGWVPFVGSLALCLLTLLTIGVMTALKLQVLKEWR